MRLNNAKLDNNFEKPSRNLNTKNPLKETPWNEKESVSTCPQLFQKLLHTRYRTAKSRRNIKNNMSDQKAEEMRKWISNVCNDLRRTNGDCKVVKLPVTNENICTLLPSMILDNYYCTFDTVVYNNDMFITIHNNSDILDY